MTRGKKKIVRVIGLKKYDNNTSDGVNDNDGI